MSLGKLSTFQLNEMSFKKGQALPELAILFLMKKLR